MDEYDSWNRVKKRLALTETCVSFHPQEGQVWIGILGKNIGNEQNGGAGTFTRPLLVVKKFNTKMFWIVPLSSKQKNLDFYYNFRDPHSKEASLILSQLRLVSVRRFKRYMYSCSPEMFSSVRSSIQGFLD